LGSWPTRRPGAALCRRFRPAKWGGFYKAAELKPHQSRYWLNARPADPQAFAEQVAAVCAVYRQAPAQAAEDGTHTLSVDERTGIQRRGRVPETSPMKPGKADRREFEYQRQGTLCLIGNFDVVTGTLTEPTTQAPRTEADFAAPLVRTVATAPPGKWV